MSALEKVLTMTTTRYLMRAPLSERTALSLVRQHSSLTHKPLPGGGKEISMTSPPIDQMRLIAPSSP
jgi:hypothetical protein